jgi:hypothetical protein
MTHLARAFALCVAFALAPSASSAGDLVLDVYKSPSCHCCVDWMKHLEQDGIGTRSHHPDDLDAQKAGHGIPEGYTSCHTGVSADGYVFEGHVPAKYIRRFLANPPPDARGLLVPGMPLGSPGMESDDFFMPYKIMLLKKDGSVALYASVGSAAQQFDDSP